MAQSVQQKGQIKPKYKYIEIQLFVQTDMVSERNLHGIYKICLYKDYKSKILADLILNEKKNSLVVEILEDEDETTSHAVGINIGRRVIFYHTEQKTLVLNKGNLSICCGVNSVVYCIENSAQMKLKPQLKQLRN